MAKLTVWYQLAQVPAPPQPPAPAQTPASAELPAAVGADVAAPGKVIVNGKEIGLSIGNGSYTVTGVPQGFNDIPPGVQSIATTAIVSVALMIAAFPIFGFMKALINRRASTQALLPSRDTTDRLQRIEAAVETMSVEVERISEGQRFVTRLLSERSSTSPT